MYLNQWTKFGNYTGGDKYTFYLYNKALSDYHLKFNTIIGKIS